MSMISAVHDWLLTYDGLANAAPLLVDTLGATPTQYALVPLPGPRIVQTFISGKTRRQFPFALQSMEFATDDEAREANYEFYEDFALWVEEQNESKNFPTLDAGTPESVEVLGHPILFALGDSGTAIYQIQLRLTYTQARVTVPEGSSL